MKSFAFPSMVNLSSTLCLPADPNSLRFLEESSLYIEFANELVSISHRPPTSSSNISVNGGISKARHGVPEAIDSKGIKPCP